MEVVDRGPGCGKLEGEELCPYPHCGRADGAP